MKFTETVRGDATRLCSPAFTADAYDSRPVAQSLRRRFRPKQCVLATSLAVLQISASYAQTAPAAEANPAASVAPAAKTAEDKAGTQLDRVVITGNTSLKRTVRESSVAVTVADREQLDRKAPRSTASALELVPGIMVEDSGGESSNNFSVRGLAGGGQQFIQLHEDGLPVFYTNALTDTILKQELFIDRMEAVRGGTSGILTVNGAGATINFMTFKNKEEPEGAFRVTTSTFNTKRLDLRYGGALGDGWFGGVGGFLRDSGSVRDTSFTADHGGLFRGYLGKKIEGGEFSVNVKLVNDHNTFLLPIPLQNPRSPTAIPGMNANYGTLLGPDNAAMTVKTSAATGATSQVNDAMNDGISTNSKSIGYAFDKALSKEWSVRSKGRYTNFKNDFNSVFSFSNDGLQTATNRLDPNANADVKGMLNRFAASCGGSCTPGLQMVSTGSIISGANALNAMNGNGLLAENVTAKNKRYLRETVNDASTTWTTKDNSLTVGWLAFDTHIDKDQNVGATTFLSDVRNNANRMDIVALDKNGKIQGYLTDKGVLQYGAWGEGMNNSHSTSNSLYVNNEWKANDRFRVDGGFRLEHYRFTGYQGIGATDKTIAGAFDANGNDVDNVMANNQFGGAFGGTYRKVESSWTKPSYTFGSNYLLNDNMAVYGRYSASYQANNENPVTQISFAELGYRYKQKGFSGTLTAFHTDYKDFRGFSRNFGNDTLPTVANSDLGVNGLEFEAAWRPARWAGLNLTGVLQKSKVTTKGVTGPSAALYAAEVASYNGNRPERTPSINFTLSPVYYLADNKGEVALSYHHIGNRFADLANSIELPAYKTVDIALRYELTPKITLNASVQNLTNTIGLTEGNPRASSAGGFAEGNGSKYFFARPIMGRNGVISLTFAL